MIRKERRNLSKGEKKKKKRNKEIEQEEEMVLHFSEKIGTTLTFLRCFVVQLVASKEDSCCQQSQYLLLLM